MVQRSAPSAMKNLYALGKRIERLLMLAGPLAFFCLLFLFISYSNTAQIETQIVERLRFAADAVFENISELENKYKLIKQAPKNLQDFNRTAYNFQLKNIVLQADRSTRSLSSLGGYAAYSETISPRIVSKGDQPPRQFVISLIEEAEKLRKTRPTSLGIELPEKAKISVFGTDINIETSTYLTLMQVSLAPVLILWLGSIYVTRYRESLLIKDAKSISDLFPHIINIYPIGKIPDLKKRSWIKYYSRYLIFLIYFLLRVLFLLIFIGVPVTAYVGGSYLQFNIDSNIYPMLLGALVALISCPLILVKLLPFHFVKIFNDHSYPIN